MRAEIDAGAEAFPDLLARSAEVLRELLGEALDGPPAWAGRCDSRTILVSVIAGSAISSVICWRMPISG
jgi:hypothetical protein